MQQDEATPSRSIAASELPLASESLSIDAIERQLDQVVSKMDNSVLAAAAKFEVTRLREYLHQFRRRWTDLNDGKVYLTDAKQLQSTCSEIFATLVRAASESKCPQRYRSVSICRTKDYFDQAAIRILGESLEAVIRNAASSTFSAGRLVTVDRYIIVPARYFPHPQAQAKDLVKMKGWWRQIYDSLCEHTGPDLCGGALEVSLSVLSVKSLADAQIEPIDFGLYGDLAVGIYERGNSQVLKICDNTAPEFADCVRLWNLLKHGSFPRLTWCQLVTRLDVDQPEDDPT